MVLDNTFQEWGNCENATYVDYSLHYGPPGKSSCRKSTIASSHASLECVCSENSAFHRSPDIRTCTFLKFL